MSIRLNSAEIFSGLSPKVQEFFENASGVQVFDEIDSTQDCLKLFLKRPDIADQIEKNRAKMYLVAAESQLLGKGRMSRTWNSTAGKNILLSCSWHYSSVPRDLAGLSLALIVELTQFLRDKFDLPFSIKWPNDLLLNGEKIAGLLVDIETGYQCKLIIGLGLNVSQTFDRQEVEQSWTDLSKHGVVDLNRNGLISDIVMSFTSVLNSYPEQGFSSYQHQWNNLSEHRGKKVKLVMRSTQSGCSSKMNIEGLFEGVDENGFLLLRTNEGLETISDSAFSLQLIS